MSQLASALPPVTRYCEFPSEFLFHAAKNLWWILLQIPTELVLSIAAVAHTFMKIQHKNNNTLPS